MCEAEPSQVLGLEGIDAAGEGLTPRLEEVGAGLEGIDAAGEG
jgi:hypothetical protein